MKAEVRLISEERAMIKECGQPLNAGKVQETFSPGASKKDVALLTHFRLLSSSTIRKLICVV